MSGSKPRKNWKCVNPKCDANLNPTTKSPKLSTKWFYRPTGISSVFPHAKAEEVEYCCRSCSDKHRKIKQDEHANALRPKLRSRRHVAAPVPKFSDKVVDGCKRELERLAGDRSPCDISIQVSATPFKRQRRAAGSSHANLPAVTPSPTAQPRPETSTDSASQSPPTSGPGLLPSIESALQGSEAPAPRKICIPIRDQKLKLGIMDENVSLSADWLAPP